MLENDAARELYHEHAARMPIIDYHCHLVPQMIAENRRFGNITEAWLGGVQCGPTASKRPILPVTNPIGRNLRNGPERFLMRCAIRFITGPISSWPGFSASMKC